MPIHRTPSTRRNPLDPFPNALRRLAVIGVVLGSLAMTGPPASANLNHEARHVGHSLGSAAHDVGRKAKRAGLTIGHEAKRVGLAIGHAARAGGLAFWHAIKGRH